MRPFPIAVDLPGGVDTYVRLTTPRPPAMPWKGTPNAQTLLRQETFLLASPGIGSTKGVYSLHALAWELLVSLNDLIPLFQSILLNVS